MNKKYKIEDRLMNEYLSEAFELDERDLHAEIAANPELKQEVEIQKAVFGFAAEDNAGISIPDEVTAGVMNAIGSAEKRFFVPAWGIALLIVSVISLGTLGYTQFGETLFSSFDKQNSEINDNSYTNNNNATNLNSASTANTAGIEDNLADMNSKTEIADNEDLANNSSSDMGSIAGNSDSRNENSRSLSGVFGKENEKSDDSGRKVVGNTIATDSPDANDIAELISWAEDGLNLGFVSSISSLASSLFADNDYSVRSGQDFYRPELVNNSFVFTGSHTFIDNTRWRFAVDYLPMTQTAQVVENQSYANTAFRAGYRISRNSTLGLEFGFDNYNQQFDSDYGKVNFNQTPVLFYYGAYWRYSPESLSIGTRIYPYVQAFGGGTVVGPIAKGTIGTKIRVVNNLYVNIGAEYGMLIYNVENVIYNSDKYGMTFGLQFNY
jgi:hypothetical protein